MEDCRFKSWRHALFASGATVVAEKNRAEDIPSVAFVVREPAAPAKLVGNVAVSDDPNFKVVEAELGDNAAVMGAAALARQSVKEDVVSTGN